MTYYGAKEIASSFRTVRGNTIKIAEEIPEEHYNFQPAEGARTVAQTLQHIAVMSRVPELTHFVEHRFDFEGFDFLGLMGKLAAESQAPRTKAEIIDLLRTEGEKFAALLDGATEEFLAERVAYPAGMMPPSKSRFEMLIATKEHEMHHRGQLMLIQRMLGATTHLTRHMQEIIASMQAQQQAQQ
jgi:uncharacterized damage-inducible protein DinB